jgi:hypothetical protein
MKKKVKGVGNFQPYVVKTMQEDAHIWKAFLLEGEESSISFLWREGTTEVESLQNLWKAYK